VISDTELDPVELRISHS